VCYLYLLSSPCVCVKTAGQHQPHDTKLLIDSGAVGGASYLDRARAKASPLSPIDLWEEQTLSALTRLHWETKLSLYGDTRHCGRAGEVFSREGKKQAMTCARRVARSKERGKGARMTFGTKLDGLATRSKAEEWTWRIGTDTVRRWGPLRGRCRGTLRERKRKRS
jgi:hypothetical protein